MLTLWYTWYSIWYTTNSIYMAGAAFVVALASLVDDEWMQQLCPAAMARCQHPGDLGFVFIGGSRGLPPGGCAFGTWDGADTLDVGRLSTTLPLARL